jgi:ribosome maturation factor RimP
VGSAHFFILRDLMSDLTQTHRQKIIELVEPVIEFEHIELIDVECHKMKSRWLVRIYIDKEGGVTIDDCADISYLVGDLLDVHDIPPGPYNLEISSPGLDRPLVRDKDFIKYTGSRVKIRVSKAIDGKRNFRGTLIEYIQAEEKKTIVVDEGGKRYSIPREIVTKANLEYDI